MKLITSLPLETRMRMAAALKKVPIELRLKVLREVQRRADLARQELAMTSHSAGKPHLKLIKK
jgi:hypothetical protein